jgi:hypothetical protein
MYLFLEDTDNEIIIKVETKSGESMDSSCKSEEFDCKAQLCRLCAGRISTGIYIFSGTGREQHLANKINACLPVTVSMILLDLNDDKLYCIILESFKMFLLCCIV